MAFANLSDVTTRLGAPVSDAAEVAQVNAWIADVEATIVKRIPDAATRAADDPVYLALLVKVVAQVVVRKIHNPEGKQNERIDDYSYGRERDAAKADLTPTDAEWEELEPDTAAGSAAWSIPLVATPGFSDRWGW